MLLPRFLAAATAVAAVNIAPVAAQANPVLGTSVASVEARVGLTIPVVLTARVVGTATVIARTADYVEAELSVETSANLHWSLEILATGIDFEVYNQFGDWVEAQVGLPTAVVVLAQPTNPRVTAVRIRVRGTYSDFLKAQAEFHLSPVRTPNQGAVIVSWSGIE